MDITEHSFITAKHARYYTYGNDITRAKRIWFVCHGYGQLAAYFIRNFQDLDPDENFVVAPEGLHRFYLDGVTGRVGALWMTKEARLDDIEDYVSLLTMVYKTSGIIHKKDNQQLIAFGFSQGVATISRWIAKRTFQIDNVILWAGSFPPDLVPDEAKPKFSGLHVLCCVGDEDPLKNETQLELTKKHLEGMGVKAHWHTYKGAHNIPKDALNDVIRLI